MPFVYMSDVNASSIPVAPNPYARLLASAGAPDPSAISAQSVESVGKAEVDSLLASMSNLSATSSTVGGDLRAALSSINASASQKGAALESLKKQAASLRRQLATLRSPGLAGLSGGAAKFFGGQIEKIDTAVKSGRWTELLFNTAVIAPGATGKSPRELLTDPILSQMKQALRDSYNPEDRPRLKDVAIAALDAMSRYPDYWSTPPVPPPPQSTDDASLMASAREAVFDADAWMQASGQFSSYVAANRPQGGGVVKSVTKGLQQVNSLVYKVPVVGDAAKTLDKYVPGWQVALNLIVPGGGIVGAIGTAANAATTVPLLGPALQTALSIAQPVTGISPGESFVSYGGNAAQVVSQAAPGFGPAVNLKWALTETPLQIVDRFPFSVAKVTGIYLSTHGDVLKKLTAASTEAIAQAALAIQVGAMAVSFGGAAAVIGPLDVAIAMAISASANAVKSTAAAAMAKPPNPAAWAQAGVAIAAAALQIGAAASDALAAADKAFQELQRAKQAADAARAAAASAGSGTSTAAQLTLHAEQMAAVARGAQASYAAALAAASGAQAVKTITDLVNVAGKTGLSVANAAVLAKETRKAADAARARANAKLAQIDAESALVAKEIEALKLQIAEAARQRAAIQTSSRTAPRRVQPQSALSRAAGGLGVSEMTLVLGGLALVGGIVVAASVLKDDEGDS